MSTSRWMDNGILAAIMNTDALHPHHYHFDIGRRRYTSRVVFLDRLFDAPITPPEQPAQRWQPDLAAYLQAYHAVGDDWLWHGRIADGTKSVQQDLTSPAQIIWRVDHDAGLAGFCEVIQRSALDTEILHFGLLPHARGRGLGQRLMQTVLAEVQRLGSRRIWLHTCSEDSPKALGFYQRCGFRVYATRLEWVTDPRATGILPADAGSAVSLPWQFTL